MRTSRLVALAIFLIAALSAQAREGKKTTVHATVDADGVQRIAITAGDYYFSPDHIIVKVNKPVQLSVKKESGMVPHDIVVKAPEAGIDIAEKLGEEPRVISFTPTKPGSYPIYCDKKLLFFESHRNKGMEGVLEVVE